MQKKQYPYNIRDKQDLLKIISGTREKTEIASLRGQ